MGTALIHRVRFRATRAGPRLGLALFLATTLSIACKEDIEPPPPEEPPARKPEASVKPISIDVDRSITLKADRTITIPNLVFVIQTDPAIPQSFGITLTCSRPSADGSRLTFGKFETAPSLDDLAKHSIHFAAGPTRDPTGNGIFTTAAVYQPKFAAVKITSMDTQEVRGSLSGEFYRFSAALSGVRPTVMTIEASFVAALINK